MKKIAKKTIIMLMLLILTLPIISPPQQAKASSGAAMGAGIEIYNIFQNFGNLLGGVQCQNHPDQYLLTPFDLSQVSVTIENVVNAFSDWQDWMQRHYAPWFGGHMNTPEAKEETREWFENRALTSPTIDISRLPAKMQRELREFEEGMTVNMNVVRISESNLQYIFNHMRPKWWTRNEFLNEINREGFLFCRISQNFRPAETTRQPHPFLIGYTPSGLPVLNL